MKFLLVIDMQNDFITDALGTPEAPKIIEPVCDLIRSFDGQVIYTRDTHFDDYLESQEGKKLPVVHCVKDTDGWQICSAVRECIRESDSIVDKVTFGAIELPDLLRTKMRQLQESDERIKDSGSGRRNFGKKTVSRTDAEKELMPEEIHLAGLCTDICVISNAMICKAAFPETPIYVHADCCAGVTPESHETALNAMRACQIEIV